MSKELTQEEVRRLFHYDPKTGAVTRKINSGTRGAEGSIVGVKRKDGYLEVQINKKKFLLHRVIFLYMVGKMPKYEIDHIDGSKSNNSSNAGVRPRPSGRGGKTALLLFNVLFNIF